MFLKKVSGEISKTMVFNLLVLLVGVLELLKVSPALPAEAVPYIILGVGVVNLILRQFFTTEPMAR